MDQAQKQRRRRSLEEVRQIVSEFEASGLKRDEFAESIGVSVSGLDGWRKRVKASAAATKKPSRVVPVEIKSPESNSVAFEIVGPRGWTVRVPSDFDEGSLQRLLGILGREC